MTETGRALRRIAGLFHHSLTGLRRDAFRVLDVTLWPLVLLLSMTLFGGTFTRDPRILGTVVLGALGWRVIYHFQMEVVQIYMDHTWSGMLEHLMIAPVRWWDFILAGALTALLKILIIGALFLGVGWLAFGWWPERRPPRLAALAACAACGLPMATFSLGVALLRRGESFAFIFAFPDIIAVLSGVFYPTTVFPAPVRLLAQALPTTHAFDLLKATLGQAEPRPGLFALTLLPWALGSVLFVRWALVRARILGRLVKNR